MGTRTIVAVLAILLAFSASAAATVQEQLGEAYSLYINRDNEENLDQSIGIYEELLASEGLTTDEVLVVLTRLCSLYDYRGVTFLEQKDEKIACFETMQQYALRIIELFPDEAEGYYRDGVAMGRIARTRGILNSLFMAKPMRDRLLEALERDPDHVDALRVLSMLYSEAPGWPLSIGSSKKAMEYAEKAYALKPDDPGALLQLAKVKWSSKEKTEAIQLAQMAVDVEVSEEDRVGAIEDKAEAAQLLEEWTT